MTPSSHRPLDLRVPPVVIGAIAAGLAWLGSSFTPQFQFDFGARSAVATSVAVLGVVVNVLGVLSFRRARTTVNPTKPQAATTLVVSGIYRVTRNPMYLGALFLLTGWALWLANPVAFLTLPAFVAYLNRFQIRPEETALRSLFGPAFTTYQTRVRRWL